MADPTFEEILDGDLFWFIDWLDQQGLIVGDQDSDDKRSHEQLVRDFLTADELGEANRTTPRSER